MSAYDAIVMTLGFEPGPLVRALASHPIVEGGDVVIFVPNYEDERAERAFQDLKRIYSMIFLDERGKIKVNIRRYVINVDNLEMGISQVRDILGKYSERKVVICLSGGMRSLCIATLLGAFFIYWKKRPLITVYLEGQGKYVAVPFVADVMKLSVTDVKLEILRALKEGSRTIGELSVILNRDRSTIYRHLKWLAKNNLIEYEKHLIKLTKLGRLLV